MSSDYTVSIHYDRRLYRQDIAGSVVHARMLARQGIVSNGDASAIVSGLNEIRDEIERSIRAQNSPAPESPAAAVEEAEAGPA